LRGAATKTHQEYAAAFDKLKSLLGRKGLFICHSVIAALGNRILRSGSTERTDSLLHRLSNEWRRLEEELQVEIDSRVFAYLQSGDEAIDQAIECFDKDPLEQNPRRWRFNAIFSMLWPRGGYARSARLAVYNPFSQLPATEHDLVRLFLDGEPVRVSVEGADWRQEMGECLIRDGEVILEAPSSRTALLRDSLLSVVTVPVDTGFMLVHPRINGIDRRGGSVSVALSLSEGMQ